VDLANKKSETAMKSDRVLPWVGWRTGEISFLLLRCETLGRLRSQPTVATEDPFVEVTRLWWERFASSEDWKSAAELGRVCTKRRPKLAYGWENWTWALHRLGETEEAYRILSPVMKRLKLPGPPSGRSAYCLACFAGALGNPQEGVRWLNLAYVLAEEKDAFRHHALLEPDLREVWPSVPELASEALSLLE
jgi:hypothetical protein